MTDLARRRLVVSIVALAVPAVLVLALGHRGVHMARSLLVPGAGLVDARPAVAIGLVVATVLATVAWVRWGMDWTVAAVVVVAVVLSGVLPGDGHHVTVARSAVEPLDPLDPLPGAHEFPLVVLVVGAIAWCRSAAVRFPPLRRLAVRRSRTRQGLADLHLLAPGDRCVAATLLALADTGDGAVRAVADAADVRRRCARIGLAARGRTGGDPFRVDHAGARALLAAAGVMDAEASERFLADGGRARCGVPSSEPGWVRLVDATLAAVVLTRLGDEQVGRRWAAALGDELPLRRGHRPARWWTPLGVRVGRATDWEHVLATGLARGHGWVDDADWWAVRDRVLGAAARGTAHPDDERTIAAARLWLVHVDDPVAASVLARPTVRHDPLAVATDRYASHSTPCRATNAVPRSVVERPAEPSRSLVP